MLEADVKTPTRHLLLDLFHYEDALIIHLPEYLFHDSGHSRLVLDSDRDEFSFKHPGEEALVVVSDLAVVVGVTQGTG